MLIVGMARLRIGIDKKMITDEVEELRAESRAERLRVHERIVTVEQNSMVVDPLDLIQKLIAFYADRRYTPEGVPLIEALYACILTSTTLVMRSPTYSTAAQLPVAGKRSL